MVNDPVPAAQPPQTERFAVAITGRIFPTRLRPELQPEPVRQDVERNERLADRLWSSLPYAQAAVPSDGSTAPTETVRLYEASLRALDERKREVDRLFRALCAANLEIRGSESLSGAASQQRMRAEQLQEMLARIEFEGPPVGTALTAQLVSQSPVTVHRRLEAALRKITRQFVDGFFDALDGMVDRELIGVIQWHERGACQFHFFRQSVTYEETSREFLKTSQTIEGQSGRRKVYGNWTPTTRGTKTYGHARHEHHLMSARRSSVRDAEIVIPQVVRKMLDAVPGWLQEFIGIVDGRRIRERIIERDLREEPVKECETVVRIREREVLHIDPAVTLDFYVLTGWGECDINAELDRRARQQQRADFAAREKALHERAKQNLLGGVLLLVLALVLSAELTIAGVHAGGPWTMLAGLAVIGGLAAGRLVLDAVVIRRGRTVHWTIEMAGLSALASAWTGFLFMLAGAQVWSWKLIGVGVLLFALAYPQALLTASFWKDLPPRPSLD